MAAHQAPRSLGLSRQEHWSGLPFPSPMHESEKWKGSRSVVSNPQWPHGLQPTRLLHLWNFPGRSTGVGCHCLLHSIYARQTYLLDTKALNDLPLWDLCLFDLLLYYFDSASFPSSHTGVSDIPWFARQATASGSPFFFRVSLDVTFSMRLCLNILFKIPSYHTPYPLLL